MNVLKILFVVLLLLSWFACAPPHHKRHPRARNKVAICHKGKTIYVSESAVRAHLRHGDTLGPCR